MLKYSCINLAFHFLLDIVYFHPFPKYCKDKFYFDEKMSIDSNFRNTRYIASDIQFMYSVC